MRSPRADRLARRAAPALLALVAACAHAQDGAASGPGPASAASARVAAIEEAVHQLKNDPLMPGKHTTRTLQWKQEDAPPATHPGVPAWLRWLADLATFLADTSRLLLWGLFAVVAAVLLVSLRHVVQLRSFRRRAALAGAVSHVRDLDVRPESLPDDLGAAAWALWRAGQVAAALSLLYRGALSRLIHRFGVPISASTTEGECLDLARGRLDAGALRYLTQLVRAREANIYGNRALSDAMGEALCTGFAARLDTAPAAKPEATA